MGLARRRDLRIPHLVNQDSHAIRGHESKGGGRRAYFKRSSSRRYPSQLSHLLLTDTFRADHPAWRLFRGSGAPCGERRKCDNRGRPFSSQMFATAPSGAAEVNLTAFLGLKLNVAHVDQLPTETYNVSLVMPIIAGNADY
jgi:hypothetical protein